MSNNLKWFIYVSTILKRSTQGLYLLQNLKNKGCPIDVLRNVYFAFIRSHPLHCRHIFVKMSDYLRQRILQVEQRAARIIGCQIPPTYDDKVERSYVSLFQKVITDDMHQLQELFIVRLCYLRNKCPLHTPKTKTERFEKSFL